MIVHLDFETFSHVDLKKAGMRNYASHASTDVMCLAWAIEGAGASPSSAVQLWTPQQEPPRVLLRAVARGATLWAHNAKFEREIWEGVLVPSYGWPLPLPEQWHCTAAQCGVSNLGLSLEKAAKALKTAEKDKEGHRVMLWLCKPQRGRRRFETEKLEKLGEYCKRDVEVERAIHTKMAPLTKNERAIWLLDQRINRRGVPVDLALCRGAQKILAIETVLTNDKLRDLTGDPGATVNTRNRLLNAIRTTEPELPDLKKATLDRWLDDGLFTNDVAREIATLKRRAGLASVKKFAATLDWADADGRCRWTIKHHGAGPGRWAGAGPQFQNMARAKAPGDDVREAITRGDYERVVNAGEDVTGVLGSAVRSIICAPPGRTLVQSDLSSIEARLVVWLANEEDALHAYDANEDMYILMAAKIYGVPASSIDKNTQEGALMRLVGKIAVLGLGYRAAAPTFHKNCREQFGLDVSLSFAEQVVDVFRSTMPRVVSLWRNLDTSAVLAIRTWRPCGLDMHVGDKIVLIPRRQGGHDWLTIRLPSGRLLWYFQPRIVKSKFGKDTFEYTSPKGPKEAHGGVLLQNICEGIGRDLLAGAMLTLDEKGVYGVLTVHDSYFAEIDEHDKNTPELVHYTMQTQPSWANGLPVRTETKIARRMQ